MAARMAAVALDAGEAARAPGSSTTRSRRRVKFASRLDPHEAVDLRAEVDTETELRIPRRHRRHPLTDGLDGAAFAGAERGSRVLQICPYRSCERVRAAEHAPRSPFRLHERRQGLAEITERGGRVIVERLRVIRRRFCTRRA